MSRIVSERAEQAPEGPARRVRSATRYAALGSIFRGSIWTRREPAIRLGCRPSLHRLYCLMHYGCALGLR
jgi:hypothetical protein